MNARKVRVLVYIIEYAFALYNNCTITSFISKILFENLLNADRIVTFSFEGSFKTILILQR